MQLILWMSSKELVLVNGHCSQFSWQRLDVQDQVNDLSRYYYLVFMHFVQLFRCNINVVLGYILLVPGVKAKFPLSHILKAQRGSSGIPVLFL